MGCCPSCKYDLTGLPEVGRCPECGFDYDPRATVVALRAGQQAYRLIAVALALGLITLGAMMMGTVPAGEPLWLLIVLGTLAAYYIVRLAWKSGRYSRVLLNHMGVRFDSPDLPDLVLPWPRVERARYSWMRGRFFVVGNWGETLFACHCEKLGGPSIARHCAATINRLLEHYAQEPNRSD